MPLSDQPPARLTDWVADRLGGGVAVTPAPGVHGRVQTWMLARGRRQWVLRWGLDRRKWDQQRRVAGSVWTALPGCPTLLDADAAEGALLRTALPGQPADTSPEAMHALGVLLHALHALPVEEHDALPVHEAVVRRVAAAARGLDGHDGELAVLAVDAVGSGEALRGAPRTWCHRDLRPENWLWDGHAIGLIDWEHARPDACVLDLASLAGAPGWSWVLAGYGPVDGEALRVGEVVRGVQTLAWGRRHDDARFASEGREALRRLLLTASPHGDGASGDLDDHTGA